MIEIERKFLLKNDDYKRFSQGIIIKQGYICSENDRVVRVRIYGEKAFITIKNATIGFSRDEFEYEIPFDDAEKMLKCVCQQPIIEKLRYKVEFEGFLWEVDEFLGENEGLVVAEIELEKEDQEFLKPDWIAQEVTNDVRYYNANLFKNPYKEWKM